MEKTLRVINEIARQGIIKAYAIGGGIAATYYIEPILTYDLDIFFIAATEGIDILAPIYAYAKKAGYKTKDEMILIKGIPVQFIPAYNDLIRAAVENAVSLKYRAVEARVVSAEYLIAISLQTGRPKDRERIVRLLDEAAINHTALARILDNFGLTDKFKEYERKIREK
jgi:hypothetical protein